MYSEVVLEHFRRPRHQGTVAGATCTARRENPVCGDEVTMTARVNAEGTLEEIGFQAVGCPPAIAASSFVSEWAAGRTIREAERLSPEEHNDARRAATQ